MQTPGIVRYGGVYIGLVACLRADQIQPPRHERLGEHVRTHTNSAANYRLVSGVLLGLMSDYQ